jgi:hypothetical protein
MRRRAPAALLLLALSTIPIAARAQTSPDVDPTSDPYRQGVELRKEGRDREALEKFRAAYQLTPTPRVRAQIGLAELALGQWVGAEVDLSAVLAAQGEPWIEQNRAALEQSLALDQRHLGWLEVVANVAGAELSLDGAHAATLPMKGPARVVAGTVVVEVSASGYVDVKRPTEVAAGATTRESVTLVPLGSGAPVAPPAAQPADATPPDRPASGGGTLRALGFVAGGVGLVGLGVGAWFGLQTFSAKSDRTAHCVPAGCDPQGLGFDHDARRDALVSTIGFGVGAAGLALGAWLLVRAGALDRDASTRGVVVLPRAFANGAGLTAQGAF